MDIVVNVIFK